MTTMTCCAASASNWSVISGPSKKPRPSRTGLPKDGSMEYLHMPIAHGKFDPAEAIGRIKKGDISWLTDDFMTNNYLKQIDDFADLWGQFFQRLMDSQNRPLVFHCTAGKDRTGVCAALILLTAGVPESTVIADHALSNIYNAQVINRIKHEIRKFGIDPEDMRSYLSAPRESMEAVLAHLRENYGSAKEYLIQEGRTWHASDLEQLIRDNHDSRIGSIVRQDHCITKKRKIEITKRMYKFSCFSCFVLS